MSENNSPFQEANQPIVQQSPQKKVSNQLPADIVPLPSRGLVYPLGSPLANEESIEIKAMTAKEENILTSKALIKNGTVITQLLKSCILNKTIDPDEMLSGDKNAILIGIRVTGYGAEYSAKITCPECSKEYENTFHLDQLKFKPLSAQPIEPNVNLFEFILPSSGQKVLFKLLNGHDETELVQILGAKKKLGSQIEENVTARLFQAIVEINGERDKGKINQTIQNMRALDSRALRKYMDEIEPAVDLKQPVVCPSCDERSEVTMPLGMSFFWPDLSK